ncbi:MAG: hypothetical protein QOK91_06290 [Nitrososphaeraceae archaeon]|nr:hypothetical protein [Nitrososphaeraceae archaeon]
MMLLKHSILVKVFGFVAVLLVTKAAIHQFELDLVTIGPLVTAFVGGGVIFIIAIILACTLSDYKVKKIPLELAASILILYKDVRIASIDNERINTMRDRIRLLSTINYNFKSKVWKQTDVNLAMDEIDEDIVSLAQKGTRPQFIVRLRNELANIDRISNCIETIKETTFIRAAFSVAN